MTTRTFGATKGVFQMLLNEIAQRLDMSPAQVERESLHLYLQRRHRYLESELLLLANTYGVKTVEELDRAIESGRFHENEAFDDYFRFDFLESEIDSIRELMALL